MTLKLYFDLLSQPSRALVILFKFAKIPFESCPVALRKGEHLTEEYKENVHKFGKVPAINDHGFKLIESIAITRYLATKHDGLRKLYPTDPKAQAKVDEFLEWQHHNVRAFCAMYFRTLWLEPLLTGEAPNFRRAENFKKSMEECLNQVENIWLKDTKYLAGDSLTVADIFGCCEIEQPRMAGYDPKVGRPKLTAWMERVRKETNPYYDEAHAILNRLAKAPTSKL